MRKIGIILNFSVGVIFTCLLPGAYSQSTKAVEHSIVNFDSSPLRLEPVGNTYAVKNILRQTVSGLQTACIARDEKVFTTILKLDPTKLKLQSGQKVTEIREDAPNSIKLCKERKAMLGVLSVTFADGEKWTAPIQEKQGG